MKKVISLVFAFILSMSIDVSADGYIYTQDGVLHDVETGEAVIDAIEEYYDIAYELYVLKPDKTLWHTMPDKFSFIFATDNVEKFVNQGSPRTCAVIKTDGSLWMWGDNQYGIIDADETSDYIEAPHFIMNNVKDVILTPRITMCLTNDGKLYTWGWKKYMGLGEEEGNGTPTPIMENVEKIYSGGGGYYAIKSDGSLWAWGQNVSQNGYRDKITNGFTLMYVDNVLGVNSDEYEVLIPTRVPAEGVTELDFYDWNVVTDMGMVTCHAGAIAKTDIGKTYIWGNDNETFDKAQTIKANRKAILTIDNILYAWDGTQIAIDVADMTERYYITTKGELYGYDYQAYSGILNVHLKDENVKCFLDCSKGLLYLKNDTTLVKGDYNKEVICSNVYDAFYYVDTLYLIDNAFTLYRVEKDGSLAPVLYNVSRKNVNISVLINGKKVELDTIPYIKDNRTMVPLRAIFEALGATITWDNETKTAIGVKDGTEVKITIGEDVLYKNGEAIELDCAAEITNDRTMVPVRAISEAFGCIVEWDNDMKTVEITK